MADKGKNTRRQLEVEDTVHNTILSVDSQEEIDAVNYFCEAVQLSVINDFEYQPKSFNLFDDVKYEDIDGKQRCLFRNHIYTPDFKITFNPVTQKALAKEFKISMQQAQAESVDVYIDVKGTFAGHDGGRAFSLNQKWVWSIFGTYIYKLIPKMFFKKAGCPRKSFYSSKTKKTRKMFIGMKSIAETLNLTMTSR